MIFISKEHERRYFEAIDFASEPDNDWLGAVYLITASERVFNALEPFIGDCYVDFDEVHFRAQNMFEVAIFNAAYDIYFGTDSITLSDLTFTDEIPDDALVAIANVLMYMRFGFDSGTAEVTELVA